MCIRDRADNGVEMLFNTECENIILENEECKGVLLKAGDQVRPVYADTVVIGTCLLYTSRCV